MLVHTVLHASIITMASQPNHAAHHAAALAASGMVKPRQLSITGFFPQQQSQTTAALPSAPAHPPTASLHYSKPKFPPASASIPPTFDVSTKATAVVVLPAHRQHNLHDGNESKLASASGIKAAIAATSGAGAVGAGCRRPGTLASLSLDGYLDIRQALTKGSQAVQPVSNVEEAFYKAVDLKQVLAIQGLLDGANKKRDTLTRMEGMPLLNPVLMDTNSHKVERSEPTITAGRPADRQQLPSSCQVGLPPSDLQLLGWVKPGAPAEGLSEALAAPAISLHLIASHTLGAADRTAGAQPSAPAPKQPVYTTKQYAASMNTPTPSCPAPAPAPRRGQVPVPAPRHTYQTSLDPRVTSTAATSQLPPVAAAPAKPAGLVQAPAGAAAAAVLSGSPEQMDDEISDDLTEPPSVPFADAGPDHRDDDQEMNITSTNTHTHTWISTQQVQPPGANPSGTPWPATASAQPAAGRKLAEAAASSGWLSCKRPRISTDTTVEAPRATVDAASARPVSSRGVPSSFQNPWSSAPVGDTWQLLVPQQQKGSEMVVKEGVVEDQGFHAGQCPQSSEDAIEDGTAADDVDPEHALGGFPPEDVDLHTRFGAEDATQNAAPNGQGASSSVGHIQWLASQVIEFSLRQDFAVSTESIDPTPAASHPLLGCRVAFLLMSEFEHVCPRGVTEILPPGIYQGRVSELLGSCCQSDMCEEECTGPHSFFYVKVLKKMNSGRLELKLDLHNRHRCLGLPQLVHMDAASLQDAWLLLKARDEDLDSGLERATGRARVKLEPAEPSAGLGYGGRQEGRGIGVGGSRGRGRGRGRGGRGSRG